MNQEPKTEERMRMTTEELRVHLLEAHGTETDAASGELEALHVEYHQNADRYGWTHENAHTH